MSGYHVGCGLAGIYAGTLNPKGDTWRNKSDVTREAMSAVAQYLLFNEKKYCFEHMGENYVLAVRKEGEG